MTLAGPVAGKARARMRTLLLRLSITLYAIPFLISGIVMGFAAIGWIVRVWPWSGAGGSAAMLVACAAVVAACIWLGGWIAWVVMLAILLPAMRRWPARFTGFVLVGEERPPWYGRPFRWIAQLALRRWPVPVPGPAAHADADADADADAARSARL